MTLSDDQKKRLTMFLGETSVYESIDASEFLDMRSFTTWQDLGDLKRQLEEKGMWPYFEEFAFDRWFRVNKYTLTEWLMNPSTFIPLVAEFLESK